MPSNAPTLPSLSPTQSPTECPDDIPKYSSNDGEGIRINKTQQIADILSMMRNISDSDTQPNATCGIPFKKAIGCDGNIDICYFECIEDRSCGIGMIQNYNISIQSMTVNCVGGGSCYGTSILTKDSSINTINIVCEGYSSCESMDIEIVDANIDTLHIQCLGSNSCNNMDLKIKSYTNKIMILCQNADSCINLNYDTYNSNINDMILVCHQQYSCHSMSQNWQIYDSSLSIYCMDSFSCSGLDLDMISYQNTTPANSLNNLNVTCFMDDSCNNLVVKSHPNTTLDINMYSYSENVTILHGDVDKINMNCGYHGDELFIKYDIATLKTDDQLLDYARLEYDSDSGYLPCEGVSIKCTTIPTFERSCEYSYDINHTQLNLIKYMTVAAAPNTSTTCFWIDISNIFDPVCYGECQIDFYEYNTTLKFDAAINNSNLSTYEREYKCEEFFGDENITESTLMEITAIFEKVIDIAFDAHEIYQLLDGPDVFLQDDKLELNCSDPTEFETVHLTISMTSRSPINDSNEFQALWTENADFSSESEKLLSSLFGVDVNVYVKHVTSFIDRLENAPWINGYVSAIVIGLTVLICVLLVGICCRRSRRRKELNLMTTYIQNPLVLCIAIGKYDHMVDGKEVNGYFPNLDAIDNDIKNLVTLFGMDLNYRIIPNYDINQQIKTEWTKKEILNLFQDTAEDLDKLVKNNEHDGLIVAISCHGIQDHIITSDYKLINKDTIHRIFSVDYPSLRDIPGIFVYDCCDGSSDRVSSARSSMEQQPPSIESLNAPLLEPLNVPLLLSMSKSVENEREIIRKGTTVYGSDSELWFQGEPNPDYKLVIINSSNRGFVSQMGAKSGSYMIKYLVKKLKENIYNNKNRLFLFQIHHQVQEILHSQGMQLVEAKYNNKLEYIKFKRNDNLFAGMNVQSEDTANRNVELSVMKDIRSKPEINKME